MLGLCDFVLLFGNNFALRVFSQNFEFSGKGLNGFKGLTVSEIICVFKVDVKKVFPFFAYDREGLDFREVDVKEGKYGKYFCEAPYFVGEGETNRGFGGLWIFVCRGFTVAKNEEAGVIFFIAFYAASQNFQLVIFCGLQAANGADSPKLFVMDFAGGRGCVGAVNELYLWVIIKKSLALEYGHGVGVYGFKILNGLSGKGDQI